MGHTRKSTHLDALRKADIESIHREVEASIDPIGIVTPLVHA